MKFKKLYLMLLLIFIIIVGFLFVIYKRHQALQDPNSCLTKKNEILLQVKKEPGTVGWTLPHCDIFGNWRAQQNNDGGYMWCVTKDGTMIAGTYSQQQPKQCYLNTIQNIYINLFDDLF